MVDQGTQTEVLQITEPLENGHEKTNGHYYHTIERETVLKRDPQQHKLRKSASFSSSSGNSLASNSMNSHTSSLSLRSSPLRSSHRMLKSDTINTFQKWETTVESISYVTTKTVSISGVPTDKAIKSNTLRSRSTTPSNKEGTTNVKESSKAKMTNGHNGTAEKDVFSLKNKEIY
ncbi:hypothetical protein FF38_07215 [Lucilia cuprina]|uniref:Uncharacterized protein n=1 Tax=Lucilia cuprina TaxID=7375 RepID=A0A0L0CRU6_LUCCU|nr:hypothetical protein FF38_07215 [Lucilia cuprina]